MGISGTPRPPRAQGSFRKEPPAEERPLRELLRLLRSPVLNPSQTEHFLKLALEIMNTGTTAVKQSVIKELASEQGLKSIQQLVEAHYENNRTSIRTMGFWKHCLPFLALITHDELQSSLILETAVGTIYNVVYGVSGARALPFFAKVTANLSATTAVSSTSEEYNNALHAISSAILMTLKVNQSASVQKEFTGIVKTLRDCYPLSEPSDYSGRRAYGALRKIEQKLHIGDSIPVTTTRHINYPTTYLYEAEVDLPGELSKYGPRHDNDQASIKDIKILPTMDEIMSNSDRNEYIPFRDYLPQAHHLAGGIDRILDTQFRLLREDTTGQLRDSVRHVIQKLSTGSKDIPKSDNGTQTIIYNQVTLDDFVFDTREGLQLNISFNQPQKVMGKKLPERMTWWETSRYLQFGALLALVNSKGLCLFLTVTNRATKNTIKDKKPGDDRFFSQSQGRINNLVNDENRATVTLKLVDELGGLKSLSREFRRQREGHLRTQCLVEFPGLLFASFEPILKVMQNLIGTATIPFPRWIAPEGYDGSTDQLEINGRNVIKVPPPLYMTKMAVSLDLGSITHSKQSRRVTHSIQNPCSVDTLIDNTTLDKGQCEALIAAFSNELALIQGPPGTGKSYVGVQLVKVLLENRSKLNLGPIVCV